MTSTHFKVCTFVWLLVSAVGMTAPVMAQNNNTPEPNEPLDISNNPLFVSVSIGPNIMFTLDDSGSMQWEYMPATTAARYNSYMFPMPANLYGGVTYNDQIPNFDDDNVYNFFNRSAANNKVFYNPDLTYRPWTNADGTRMPDADPENALYNPAIPGLGGLNLTSEAEQYACWFSYPDVGGVTGDPCRGNYKYWPITYFNYKGGDRYDRDSYEKVEINNSVASGVVFVSPNGTVRTRSEEIQNFANWFSYHRSRILTSRGAIGQAFDVLPSAVRVGFAAINEGDNTVDGVETGTIVSGVREFDATGRTDFYSNLYDRTINNFGTPLRSSAVDVGEYYERIDDQGPWSTTPGFEGGQNLACRQSYHILMTDGYWNGSSPGVANADGTNGTTITGPEAQSYQYVPTDPFQDSYSNTLADVAMDYWKRDLVNLDNRVPTSQIDPAFWQHVTSFGVGLGVRGSIDPDEAFAAIGTGDEVPWPDPTDAENDDRIDDLLHFGLNGRGGFFSASDPDAFAQELGAILTEIVERSDATTSVAVSATRLTTESLVYAASFDSEDWSGEVAALNAETGEVEYLATEQLETLTAGNRKIFTYDPSGGNPSGIAFNAAAATEIGLRLMADAPVGGSWTAENLIEYIRGSDAEEQSNEGSFRNRDVMLGDIVNSRPFFSGAGNEGWGRLDDDYLDYIEGPKNDPDRCDEVEGACNYGREDTLFIGANDGMLHAFDAETMDEFFAYVPAASHGELHRLADPDYTHRFFVDGQVTVADAKRNGQWGTFLVGTMGAGGRGIFALDVTDPETFSADDVLWEFTAEDDPDLGYTFGEPVITRIGTENSGKWVAIFGNGYNSDEGQAYLYIVDLFGDPSNPSSVEKIALGTAGSNGLSGVAGWRDPATRTFLSRVYAGDLNGTIWRVDFDGTTPSVVYEEGLFTDPDGRAITATPNIAASPAGGLIAYVGTGKLIEDSDRLSASMDRFYAIRDRGDSVGNNFNNNGLAEVTLGEATPVEGQPPLRTVETDGVGENGWYMNLAVGDTSNGERTLSKPRVVFGTVILSTYQPIEDPCRPGGVQRTYVLDALSGAGSLPYCSNCGAIEVGTGAPFSPPVTIRQREPGSVGEVTFPGNPDPAEPGDPGDFPGAPPADGGDPQGWCSEFGIPPLFEGGSFLSLGTICEGRQVWREAR